MQPAAWRMRRAVPRRQPIGRSIGGDAPDDPARLAAIRGLSPRYTLFTKK